MKESHNQEDYKKRGSLVKQKKITNLQSSEEGKEDREKDRKL